MTETRIICKNTVRWNRGIASILSEQAAERKLARDWQLFLRECRRAVLAQRIQAGKNMARRKRRAQRGKR